MKELPIMEVRGQRVLTTKQIAEAYGTTKDKIIYNFNYNRGRYVKGKHYIELKGEELRDLKRRCENQISLKYAKSLYLWTEKGALLHAKSLNTNKAWEVYDYLVDFYFRVKEKCMEVKPASTKIQKRQPKEFPQMDNPIRIFKVLMKVAEDNGIEVDSFPFKYCDSRLYNNHIGIRTEMPIEKVTYELAWELSHAFIHHNNGDMIKSPLSRDYNEQATRAAEMIIKMLNVTVG